MRSERMRCGGWRMFVVVAAVMGAAQVGRGYPVGAALTLDKLTENADVVVKVEAGASEVVKDEAFTDYTAQGYAVFGTKLKVISVLKGDGVAGEMEFRHYDAIPKFGGAFTFMPQVYHLEAGKTYLLWAKKEGAGGAGVFRTMSFNHTAQDDQGLLRTAGAEGLPAGMTVKAAVWRELGALLASKDVADVKYGIVHLNYFSDPTEIIGASHEDFPRKEALDLMVPLLGRKEAGVAMAALEAIGSASPYWRDDTGWLATYGKGKALKRGWSTRAVDFKNGSAVYCRGALVGLANSEAEGSVRGQAVRALGKSRENAGDVALAEELKKWTVDKEAEVRAGAALLWADYPSAAARESVQQLAGDKEARVRAATASGIGFMQAPELLGTLEGMLEDKQEEVCRAAAVSVLSFDVKEAGEVMKRHVKDGRYGVAFINALAEADPGAWADELAGILRGKAGPETSLTGQVPRYTAWDILLTYVEKADAGALRGGRMAGYLEALESPPDIGSGPYQRLYQFYHDKGMTERMRMFREKALKAVTAYDLDMFFKRIDGREK